MTRIIFASTYGSTAEYARELAARLGAGVSRIDAQATPNLAPGEPLIAMSPVHGPSLPAAQFVKDHLRALGDRPIAVVGVGMSVRPRDQIGHLLGDRVVAFYLPGRLRYSELSQAHAKLMLGLVAGLKLKPRKSVNDQAIIDGYGKDVDRVDFAKLEPIQRWAAEHAPGA